MTFNYCQVCGDRLVDEGKEDGSHRFCRSCGEMRYRNPTIGVAVILMRRNDLLLVRRVGSYGGQWCIPCGHVEWGEDVRAAARRELREETGLDARIGSAFAVHSNFHDPKHLTVGVWFWGTQVGGHLAPGSDADRGEFFPLDHLPQEIAFPTDLLVCEKLSAWMKNGELARWIEIHEGRQSWWFDGEMWAGRGD